MAPVGDAVSFPELLALPFLQRALLAGALTGALGGVLGSFAVLRQLSFFSDALGHSALLGISLGVALGLNPTLVLIPFAVLFALLVNHLVERSQLPTDALLNIIYSSSLAIAVVALSLLPGYQGGLQQLLFGDILGVDGLDLLLVTLLLLGVGTYLLATRSSQILLSLDESLALSRGVEAQRQRLLFVVVLAVVVAVSIKAVGVLLISAFVVIPACAARLVSRHFGGYVLLAAALGSGGAVVGVLASAFLNLPSGPCVVIVQLLGFLLALAAGRRLQGRAA
ncbi:metal ABC transporter permease [Synechococcus sp. CCY9201]|nr:MULTISPECIES: metal ABC transporter permease [unclassified Synechococcus]MEA5422676.1 metal ABC transporter permease [Synechococcus sp. CCY9202]MEA5474231.1 metal ABC transporter permease [Synechococcus sp. CCY9201]CAK6693327.1 High-affinity zinc uptake system membrane protein ZnuB [Synechococcus sp. CBW1107]